MSYLIELAGAVGSFLFATACVPMAWKTWRAGKGIGTPLATIWTFVGATALFGVYLGEKVGWAQIPTILVIVEFLCWSLALWYEYRPRLERVGECIREPYHDGPCNGYPSPDCYVYDKKVGFARPLREHSLPNPHDEQCVGRGCGNGKHGASCPHYFEDSPVSKDNSFG